MSQFCEIDLNEVDENLQLAVVEIFAGVTEGLTVAHTFTLEEAVTTTELEYSNDPNTREQSPYNILQWLEAILGVSQSKGFRHKDYLVGEMLAFAQRYQNLSGVKVTEEVKALFLTLAFEHDDEEDETVKVTLSFGEIYDFYQSSPIGEVDGEMDMQRQLRGRVSDTLLSWELFSLRESHLADTQP